MLLPYISIVMYNNLENLCWVWVYHSIGNRWSLQLWSLLKNRDTLQVFRKMTFMWYSEMDLLISTWFVVLVYQGKKIIERYHICRCIFPDHFDEIYYSYIQCYFREMAYTNTEDEFEQHFEEARFKLINFSKCNKKLEDALYKTFYAWNTYVSYVFKETIGTRNMT